MALRPGLNTTPRVASPAEEVGSYVVDEPGSSAGRTEDQPGWAAPGLPAREPAPDPAPSDPAPSDPAPSDPAPVAGPAWAAPAPFGGPTPPRSSRWVIVLVAVLAITAAAAIAGTVLFVENTLPPYQAAHDFVSDVVHGRTAAAEARLCAADRENPAHALDLVPSVFDGSEYTVSVNVLAVDRDGSQAITEYTVNFRGRARSETFRLDMLEEGGEWKACPSIALR